MKAVEPPLEASDIAGGWAGNADALRELYESHAQNLARFAWRLTHDRAAAEDLVQEAFTRLAARRLLTRRPVPYLYRVVENLAVDAWRRSTRDERLQRVLAPAQNSPPYEASLYDAIRRLPRAERAVVTLYYLADLPIADVAAILRKPPGTVAWHLTSARQLLAKSLGESDA